MLQALLLTSLLATGAAAEFQAAFPAASVVASPAGDRLTSASGFEATGLGETAEAAARRFLAEHGAAFGVTARQELVLRAAPRAGRAGAVRFSRKIQGRPLYDGDVVVGVDARAAVILVNAADVPARLAGRPRIGASEAIRAATEGASLEQGASPRAERGWRAAGRVIRPVWRIDYAAAAPAGHWRAFVDAETGAVLFRTDLRTFQATDGVVPRIGPPREPGASPAGG